MEEKKEMVSVSRELITRTIARLREQAEEYRNLEIVESLTGDPGPIEYPAEIAELEKLLGSAEES